MTGADGPRVRKIAVAVDYIHCIANYIAVDYIHCIHSLQITLQLIACCMAGADGLRVRKIVVLAPEADRSQ